MRSDKEGLFFASVMTADKDQLYVGYGLPRPGKYAVVPVQASADVLCDIMLDPGVGVDPLKEFQVHRDLFNLGGDPDVDPSDPLSKYKLTGRAFTTPEDSPGLLDRVGAAAIEEAIQEDEELTRQVREDRLLDDREAYTRIEWLSRIRSGLKTAIKENRARSNLASTADALRARLKKKKKGGS